MPCRLGSNVAFYLIPNTLQLLPMIRAENIKTKTEVFTLLPIQIGFELLFSRQNIFSYRAELLLVNTKSDFIHNLIYIMEKSNSEGTPLLYPDYSKAYRQALDFLEKGKKKYFPKVELSGHNEKINSVVISNCERFIASGSVDKKVKLWSIDKKIELFSFDHHTGSVESVGFSGDSYFIVSGSSDTTIKI